MAISIDRVYQTVLALANKEQRGYITPQEFNLFANHAQNSIFEQYFYDLNQFRRIPGNNTKTSDPRDIIEDKISMFRHNSWVSNASAVNEWGDFNLSDSFPNLYRLDSIVVRYDGQSSHRVAEQIDSRDEFQMMHTSKMYQHSKSRPVYLKASGSAEQHRVKIFPNPGEKDNVRISYIKKPTAPKWTYVVVNNKALWNPSAADKQDFELHASEEKNLVIKILQLAGVSIKDYNLTQIAAQEEIKNIQQEKQ